MVTARTVIDAQVMDAVRDVACATDHHGRRKLTPEGLYGRRKMTAQHRAEGPRARPPRARPLRGNSQCRVGRQTRVKVARCSCSMTVRNSA